MAETLVIKCNILKHPADVEILRQSIIEQRKSGVVILPCYCEAIVVLEDAEIITKDCSTCIYGPMRHLYPDCYSCEKTVDHPSWKGEE